jgi:hypothetical protein
MPLRKDIESPHGATAQHHWIAQRVNDYRTNKTEVVIYSFINRQARIDGKEPLIQSRHTYDGILSNAEVYTALAADGALLDDAIDEA